MYFALTGLLGGVGINNEASENPHSDILVREHGRITNHSAWATQIGFSVSDVLYDSYYINRQR